ncbi:unnamed protein product, partial [Linum tenue]
VSECPTLSRRGKFRPTPTGGSSSHVAAAYHVTLGSSEGSSSSAPTLTPNQVRHMVQEALCEALSSTSVIGTHSVANGATIPVQSLGLASTASTP